MERRRNNIKIAHALHQHDKGLMDCCRDRQREREREIEREREREGARERECVEEGGDVSCVSGL